MEASQRKMSLIPLLGLIAGIAVLHYLGFALQLYWRLGWYDRIVHTLGGLWVGLMAFSLLSIFHVRFTRALPVFLVSLVAAVAIGVSWELFELRYGITNAAYRGYSADTTGDILSDVAGGMLAYFYTLRFWKIRLWKLQK